MKIASVLPLMVCLITLASFSHTALGQAYVPALQTPVNASETVYPFPNFSWERHPDAWKNPAKPASYDIQIAKDASFDTLFDSDSVSLPRYVYDHPLAEGTYHWRVRGQANGGEQSLWSHAGSFTVLATDEIVTVSPAKGDAGSGAAVQEAVAKAQQLSDQGRSVRLVFEPGEYQIEPTLRGALFQFEQASNVLVDGADARIHFANRHQGLIEAIDSKNIAVMGFSCTYPTGAYGIQGFVKAIDEDSHTVTLSIVPGFPGFDASDNLTHDTFMLLEPDTDGQLKNGVRNFFRGTHFQHNADGTWAITMPSDQIKAWDVGDRYCFNFRSGSAQFINYGGSHAVTAYRITTTGYGAMQYVSKEGSLFNILHGKTLLADGDWMTGNADGVHIRGHAVGPWIEGTMIQAIGDDAIALYARPSSIQTPRPDGNPKAAYCRPEYFSLEPGDEVSFFQPLEGAILLETQVVSVKPRDDGYIYVTFADDIPSDIKTDGPLVKNTQIWNRSKSCGDFMVRNCTFKNIRRYGAVFRSKGGVVENNHFSGISSRAIVFINGTMWPNGLYASEIIVRNNTIADSGFDHPSGPNPISFMFNGYQKGATTIGPRNLLIENNRIASSATPAIYLSWVKNAVLRNNLTLQADGSHKPSAYEAPNSRNIFEAK
jgi:hypothetical protein